MADQKIHTGTVTFNLLSDFIDDTFPASHLGERHYVNVTPQRHPGTTIRLAFAKEGPAYDDLKTIVACISFEFETLMLDPTIDPAAITLDVSGHWHKLPDAKGVPVFVLDVATARLGGEFAKFQEDFRQRGRKAA